MGFVNCRSWKPKIEELTENYNFKHIDTENTTFKTGWK